MYLELSNVKVDSLTFISASKKIIKLTSALQYMYLELSNVKVDSLTFISASKKIIKLPKYISTHIMLFHSIKQYQTRRCGSVYLGVVELTVWLRFVICMKDMWVVQWYCIFEGLVEMCEVK